ncbi:MAG: glycerate kinase [Gammaproteobacteria bacterium]|nr:glycerate kinase [Gammaproteobacteria bacterium]
MKIVIASDSYKESLSAAQACAAIKQGMSRVLPTAEYVLAPIADGGEGTMAAIANVSPGYYHQVTVKGPLSDEVNAKLLQLDNNTWVIEVAEACGLALLTSEHRNPLLTSSYGVGQLMSAALDWGCSTIIVGLGGSATNDGGAGMLAALGARFYNDSDELFVPTGGTLSQIAKLDMTRFDQRLSQCKVVLACDVTAPLCGELGATYMFGPQKGATAADLPLLDQGLLHFADALVKHGGADIRLEPGAGAAGGFGAGLMSLFGLKVHSGIDVVLDAIGFDGLLQDASLVITGEGLVDGQTEHGKAPIGVAKRAKAQGISTLLLCGGMADGYQAVYDHGIDAVFSATPKVLDLPTALGQATDNLANLAENVARLVQLKIA